MDSYLKRSKNDLLRQQREMRGWSQAEAAEKLAHLCDDKPGDDPFSGVNSKMIGGWERGEHLPSLYYRRKLGLLYGKSLQELGFITEEMGEAPASTRDQLPVLSLSSIQLTPRQAIDQLCEAPQYAQEPKPGLWLALGARNLAILFEEGWSLEEIFTALRLTLQGEQAMPNISRRAFGHKVRELITAAILSNISIPTEERISAEKREQLHRALGTTLAAGWQLFHTAGSAQILAVGQAQLIQVQQASAYLYPSVRPIFYSGVHRLIGAAMHFQGQYEEAHREQEKAYIAALEGADAWNMAQSRGWQAYGLKAREKYLEALDTADAALRLVASQWDTESIRLRARLLAFSAENAASLGQTKEVQRSLESSEALLEHLPGAHEEFDRTSWFQQAGMCAVSLNQYDLAEKRLQQAFDELPAKWTLRAISTALPLASVLTRQHERDRALAVIEQAFPAVRSSQSPTLQREFTNFLQGEFLSSFPYDRRCQTFVTEVRQQLAYA